jgi:hypothetical protein
VDDTISTTCILTYSNNQPPIYRCRRSASTLPSVIVILHAIILLCAGEKISILLSKRRKPEGVVRRRFIGGAGCGVYGIWHNMTMDKSELIWIGFVLCFCRLEGVALLWTLVPAEKCPIFFVRISLEVRYLYASLRRHEREWFFVTLATEFLRCGGVCWTFCDVDSGRSRSPPHKSPHKLQHLTFQILCCYCWDGDGRWCFERLAIATHLRGDTRQ